MRSDLIDAGIHDHRTLDPMRLIDPHVPPEEDLPAAAQMRAWHEAATIDHRSRRNTLAVAQGDTARVERPNRLT